MAERIFTHYWLLTIGGSGSSSASSRTPWRVPINRPSSATGPISSVESSLISKPRSGSSFRCSNLSMRPRSSRPREIMSSYARCWPTSVLRTDLHLLRKDVADELIARLREHAAWEDRTLYPWAQGKARGETHGALRKLLMPESP